MKYARSSITPFLVSAASAIRGGVRYSLWGIAWVVSVKTKSEKRLAMRMSFSICFKGVLLTLASILFVVEPMGEHGNRFGEIM